ncbi:MAG TPA: hypothetical protein VLT88_06040, partial [Desulfosarcina sp.]|nr:hypothetical protein [Desulfosarcina sp.]
SRNWHAGVRQSGRARTINREKLDAGELTTALNDPASFRARVFFPYLELIRLWRRQPAFHPKAGFDILDTDPGIFAIRRRGGGQTLLSLTNVTARPLTLQPETAGIDPPAWDLITGRTLGAATLTLEPYQFVWLENR